MIHIIDETRVLFYPFGFISSLLESLVAHDAAAADGDRHQKDDDPGDGAEIAVLDEAFVWNAEVEDQIGDEKAGEDGGKNRCE